MNRMPLNQLGAREITPGKIQFGVFFPWISAGDNNHVFVKVIHEHDQFLKEIAPLAFELKHSVDPVYGDYWSCEVDIVHTPGLHGSMWGQPGTYVYRYEIEVLPNNFSVYFQYLSAASIKTALFINRLGLIFLNQPPFP